MSKLILLGGPTGVGKTTALHILERKLHKAAILDADDVWRVSKKLATDQNRAIAIDNVIAVMRGYFHSGCDIGIVSWVFARSELYRPVILALEDRVESVHQIYLIASEVILEQRLAKREDTHLLEYSKSRLELIRPLPYTKIDTSNFSPEEVADRVKEYIDRINAKE